MARILNSIILLLNLFCIIGIFGSIYFKIFLPYSYVVLVILLSVVLAFSIVKNGANSKIVIFQLFFIFFTIRNIYYLGTQNAIPFGDAYWDYAVEKIFLGQQNADVILGVVRPTEAGAISQLTWYSGWPFLHVIGISFSMATGIDILYLNWILPVFLSLISFVFVYLLIEKLRIRLNLPKEITLISLLLFSIFPEAIFWQMQYVRQNLAFTLLITIIYFLYVIKFEKPNRRYFFVLALLFLSMAITHHVTALTLILFLFLFSVINKITKTIGGSNKLKWVSSSIRTDIFSNISLLMLISMIFWWSRNSFIIFPTIVSRAKFIFDPFGVERFFSQAVTFYPSSISPSWVPVLLGFRDLLIYAPAIIGFLLLWRNKSSSREKYFVIYSVLAFGIILFINIVFRIEPLRMVLFFSPFLVFLTALFYNRVHNFSKVFGKIVMFLIVVLLVCSSFLGLWGHGFAPIHLYDSSIDRSAIGETSSDFITMKPFFESYINVTEYRVVRADVISPLVYLLDPGDYAKIQGFTVGNYEELTVRNTLVCSFSDLNLYQYFGYVWSPIEYSDIETTQNEVKSYLDFNFNQVYDNGANNVWASSNWAYGDAP